MDALNLGQCETFLVDEARLLDEARFDEWLALFTEDAWNRVPSQPGQVSPRNTISLMYDDRRLLETRVRRLASPRIYSQEPRSRTSRMVGNITIEETDTTEKTALVRSKFQLVEYRRERQLLYAGTSLHRLRLVEGAIRIASKRVELVNCDAALTASSTWRCSISRAKAAPPPPT